MREVSAGHDGTWVAHPGLVPLAKEIFDRYMPEANQILANRGNLQITAQDLLPVPEGDITEEGLRLNIDVGLQYVHSWLQGRGCVPIYNLMEDAATAEICRAQAWQWVKHSARLEDGRPITKNLVARTIAERKKQSPASARLDVAAQVLENMMTAAEFPEFLTLVCERYLD